MGGRGGESGITLSAKQERKLEDAAQKSDAKFEGWRLGAKNYEYTDSTGKKYTGETGRSAGGTYKAQFSERVERYAKMSTSALEKERDSLKARSDDQYQGFTRSAASRSASHVYAFVDADSKLKMINQVLRRRRKK